MCQIEHIMDTQMYLKTYKNYLVKVSIYNYLDIVSVLVILYPISNILYLQMICIMCSFRVEH